MKLSIQGINRMIFPKWKGRKVDEASLRERIEELIRNEKKLFAMETQLNTVRAFLSYDDDNEEDSKDYDDDDEEYGGFWD